MTILPAASQIAPKHPRTEQKAVGGYNSGRHGGRPTVGSGLTLDLYKLIRQRLFMPGLFRSGSIVWTGVVSGERVGSVDYEAHMAADRGHVRLRYTSTQGKRCSQAACCPALVLT
jgi:hypothetical protein